MTRRELFKRVSTAVAAVFVLPKPTEAVVWGWSSSPGCGAKELPIDLSAHEQLDLRWFQYREERRHTTVWRVTTMFRGEEYGLENPILDEQVALSERYGLDAIAEGRGVLRDIFVEMMREKNGARGPVVDHQEFTVLRMITPADLGLD